MKVVRGLVIDASVAVKWLIDEEFTDLAQILLLESRRSNQPLLAPPLLAGELANAVYQQLRRRRITVDEANSAITDFFSQPPVQFIEPPELYQRAFNFARENGLPSLYDSVYVTLAQMLDAELWTDDRRLLAAVNPIAPWVRWIGDFTTPE